MTPTESAAGAVLPKASAGRLVTEAAARLRAAGIPSPRLDAELLVGHAFGRDRAWLYAHPDAELGPSDASLLEGWIERRAVGEPIAYIRGFKEWLSLRIATDARALIPRPETELLAEAAIGEIAERLVRDGTTSASLGGGDRQRSRDSRHRAALSNGDRSRQAAARSQRRVGRRS